MVFLILLKITIAAPVIPYTAPPSIQIMESFEVAVNPMDETSLSNPSLTSTSQNLPNINWVNLPPNLMTPQKQLLKMCIKRPWSSLMIGLPPYVAP